MVGWREWGVVRACRWGPIVVGGGGGVLGGEFYLTVTEQLIPVLALERLALAEILGVIGLDPHLGVPWVLPHRHHVVGFVVAELFESLAHRWSMTCSMSIMLVN